MSIWETKAVLLKVLDKFSSSNALWVNSIKLALVLSNTIALMKASIEDLHGLLRIVTKKYHLVIFDIFYSKRAIRTKLCFELRLNQSN